MACLKNEYTDVKNIKHKVEHVILSDNKEQVAEELLRVLSRVVRKA